MAFVSLVSAFSASPSISVDVEVLYCSVYNSGAGFNSPRYSITIVYCTSITATHSRVSTFPL